MVFPSAVECMYSRLPIADTVDMIVLDRSISGTNAYDWMNRQLVMDLEPVLESEKRYREA